MKGKNEREGIYDLVYGSFRFRQDDPVKAA